MSGAAHSTPPGGDIVGSHRSAAAPDIGSSDVININISIDDGLLACTTSSAINSHKPGESYGFPHRALLLSGPPSSDGENYHLGLDNSSGSRRSSRDMETPFGLSNSNNVPRHQYHCPGCNCIDRTSFRGGNDTEYYPPISPRPVDSSIALPGQREPPSDREVFLWDEILRADKF
ncbi:hypothetical protein PG993_012560 [Apiospora rasikravindrae]|uniref:Uncharacterized protein n=1 Tax=Apiospora rasikravindrae TaxID=990691 RepID=A0ABR1S2U2_9PEZI